MAPISNAPRRLDEALRPGGLYYTADGTAIDANGRILKDAPERPEDTPENEQPHAKLLAASTVGATGAPATGMPFDPETFGAAIARGLAKAAANDDATKTATDARSSLEESASGAKIDENAPPVGDSGRVGDVAGNVPAAAKAKAKASSASGESTPNP